MSIIRLANLLKSGPGKGLEKLVRRAQNMGELTQILQAGLDSELAQGLVAANLREDGELVLVCSSSAWATRLRFEQEALLGIAAEAGVSATSCRVTVARRE